MAKRNPKDLIKLSHSELKNHFNTSVNNGIDEFLPSKVWTWIKTYVKSRFLGKEPFQFYPVGQKQGIHKMISNADGKVVIAIASDWATDTLESLSVCTLMRTGEDMKESLPDYTIHLGDVYFVGNPEEVDANFAKNDMGKSDWTYGTKGFLAIPGNHEFFSRGEGFYNNLLSKTFINDTLNNTSIKQKAGFFCLENEHWRIIGLDTGYTSVGTPVWEFLFPPESQLLQEQLDWLEKDVILNDENDKRGLIILSHHQYYSAFENGKKYPKPAEQLAKIMGNVKSKIPVIWYWGHQHLLSIYDLNSVGNGIQAYGRCIGHGGMPVELPSILDSSDIEKAQQSKLLYYNLQNQQLEEGELIGFNGFAKMTLEGKKLKVEHIQLSNEHEQLKHPEIPLIRDKVFEENWEIDISTGLLSGTFTDESQTILTKFRA
jgi:hypothetical protein